MFILINQDKKSDEQKKLAIYNLYLANINQVNNWNFVDASARDIIGAYLFKQDDKETLLTFAPSPRLWERRIAIVSSWYFIRKDQFAWTLMRAELLLNDKEDLVHKAVGWMLREVAERDENELKKFLDTNALKMARTMLRYAIEKLPEGERKFYIAKKA